MSARPEGPKRRGPGWLAVIGMAATAALVAGLGGGLAGALLVGAADDESTDVANGDVAAIAAQAVPSVVTLRVGSGTRGGTGTGWVYDTQGHIVTNNHVVTGGSEESSPDDGTTIVIETDDGRRFDGELVGRDVSYDLAVVKVDGFDAPPLTVGRSADVRVGEEVLAVGSPLGLDSTVTAGIVSALDRPVSAGEAGSESYISAIQTDAAINPGNSGGPLLSSAGEVVGVNSAIAQIPGAAGSGPSGSIGVGFAIPSDVVVRTVDQLISTGSAVHPFIGVTLDRNWSGEGAKVVDSAQGDSEPVEPDSPAAKAGIQAGDVITHLDGVRVADLDQVIVRIRAKAVGEQVSVTLQRDGQEQEVTMTLEAKQEG